MMTATAKARPDGFDDAMTPREMLALLECFRIRLGYFGARRAWIARCTVLTDEGVRRFGAEGASPLEAVEGLLRKIGGGS